MIVDVSLSKQFYRGLGDLISLCWISEGAQEKIKFFTGENNVVAEDLLKFFGQIITDNNSNAIDMKMAYEKELFESGARPRIDYMKDILNINSDVKRPNPHWSKNHETEKYSALLFPEVTRKNREWPISYWIDLYDLMNKSGINTAVCTRCKTNFEKSINGKTIEEIASHILYSKFVVSSDTFPAHFSATLGKPCFVLSGPTKPECVFSHFSEVIPIQFKDPPNCCGCHFSGEYRNACNFGCQMLNRLSPITVFETIKSFFDHDGAVIHKA